MWIPFLICLNLNAKWSLRLENRLIIELFAFVYFYIYIFMIIYKVQTYLNYIANFNSKNNVFSRKLRDSNRTSRKIQDTRNQDWLKETTKGEVNCTQASKGKRAFLTAHRDFWREKRRFKIWSGKMRKEPRCYGQEESCCFLYQRGRNWAGKSKADNENARRQDFYKRRRNPRHVQMLKEHDNERFQKKLL